MTIAKLPPFQIYFGGINTTGGKIATDVVVSIPPMSSSLEG